MPNFLHKMADKIAGTSSTSHSTKSAVVEPAPGHTVGGGAEQTSSSTSSARGDSYAPGSPGSGTQNLQSHDRTASSKSSSAATSSDLAGTSRPGGEERFKYDPSKGVVGSSHDSNSSKTGLTSSGTGSASTAVGSSDASSTRRTSTDTKIAEGVSARGGGLTGGVDEQHFDAGSTTAGSTGTSSSAVSRIGDVVKEGGSVQDALKGQGEHVRHETEPIVREHVHDEYMHVNRTRIDEIHQKTHIIQIIQPIKDTVVEGMTRERVDEGTEVRHHNFEGVDQTEQQLAQAREEYIKSMSRGESHDERHYETTEQPIINRMDRVNVVEQVVPVFESELQGYRGASSESQHTTTSGSTTRTDYGPYSGGSSSSSKTTNQQQGQELVGVVPVVAKPSDTTTTSTTTTSGTETSGATTGADGSNDNHIKQL